MNDTPKSKEAAPHILIIDDDPVTIQVLHQIIKNLGEITFATTGERGLDQISRRPPDLILLDAEMPGMDGFATCQAIKALAATADVPVLFVTSRSDVESETRALALGAVDFIHKPASPAIVLARVKTHLALKQKSDELRRLMATDVLTGLANRRAFDEALDREWRRASRQQSQIALMMIDVDFFKRYNDHYGHPAGDTCLYQVAQCLASSVKRPGDLVARYGGEEFVILVPDTSQKEAERIADDILRNINAMAIPHAAYELGHVSISLGLACATACYQTESSSPSASIGNPTDSGGANDPQALLKAADQALYQAKSMGRNRYCLG